MKIGLVPDVCSVLHLMHLGLAVLSGRAASLRRRETETEIVHMKIGLVLDVHSVLHLTYLWLAVLSGRAASVTAWSAWLLHLTAVYSLLAEQKVLGITYDAGGEANKTTSIRHLSAVARIHSSCSVPGVGSLLVVFPQ